MNPRPQTAARPSLEVLEDRALLDATATSLVLTSSGLSPNVGDTVHFTATLSKLDSAPVRDNAPLTGTLRFVDEATGQVLYTINLPPVRAQATRDSWTVSLDTSFAVAGAHQIDAVFTDAKGHFASAQAGVTLVVGQSYAVPYVTDVTATVNHAEMAVTVQWTSVDEEEAGVYLYAIQRLGPNDDTFTEVNGLFRLQGDGGTYTLDDYVTAPGSYEYRLVAYTPDGMYILATFDVLV